MIFPYPIKLHKTVNYSFYELECLYQNRKSNNIEDIPPERQFIALALLKDSNESLYGTAFELLISLKYFYILLNSVLRRLQHIKSTIYETSYFNLPPVCLPVAIATLGTGKHH